MSGIFFSPTSFNYQY